jgi:hypothetical protein
VKITQVSPRKLICEDDKFWASFTQFFVIGVIGAASFIYGSQTAISSFKLLGLYALLVGMYVCIFGSQLTTTFDLERKSVRFKRHWVIFQGKHHQEYPIQSIETIEVYTIRFNYYHPAVKLKNGKILRMTDNPMSEKDASRDIEIIRGFLGFKL